MNIIIYYLETKCGTCAVIVGCWILPLPCVLPQLDESTAPFAASYHCRTNPPAPSELKQRHQNQSAGGGELGIKG